MLNNLIKSYKKSKAIKRVSVKLTSCNYSSMESVMNFMVNEKHYLKDLFSITHSFDLTRDLVRERNVSDEHLTALYNSLKSICFPKTVAGHYIPASAFCFYSSLIFVLDAFDGEKFSIEGYSLNESENIVKGWLYNYFK